MTGPKLTEGQRKALSRMRGDHWVPYYAGDTDAARDLVAMGLAEESGQMTWWGWEPEFCLTSAGIEARRAGEVSGG